MFAWISSSISVRLPAFSISLHPLRYWDEVGILTPHKNHTNSYREYTVSDLMTISDIIFYKNLGISLQQIGAMEQAEPEEHTQVLRGGSLGSKLTLAIRN